MNQHFLSVISELGKVIENKDLTITCQSYEIEKLKSIIEKLEEKNIKGGE